MKATDMDTCIAWGRGFDHPSCPVVLRDVREVEPSHAANVTKVPAVCMCDCRVCKRAWFRAGRPIVGPDGAITTTKREEYSDDA